MLTAFTTRAVGQDSVWMVVTTETESARSGNQEIYYAITEFNKGAILAVDGESESYSKVRYPKDLGVIVKATEARTTNNGSTVELLKESNLLALSQLRGFEGSWCPVFIDAVPAGTEMKVLEVLSSDGETDGYRVEPPFPPLSKGVPYVYVKTSSLRPATKDEIDAHLANLDSEMNENPALTTDSEQNNNDEAGELIDLRDEMQIPDTETSSDSEVENGSETIPAIKIEDTATPTTTETTGEPVEIENRVPVVVDPVKSSTPKPSAAHIPASDLEALEASFTRARTMERAELDEALSELLAEFTRTRDQAGDDEGLVRALNQRIEWLNIRIATRDSRRAIEATLAQADEQTIELTQKIQRWNETRVYTMVGRLTTSGVYTGEHLPLLYRLRAPDPVTGIERTVGYLAPQEGQDLAPYLGAVVGVIGNPVRDDALSLSVLTPMRIDRIQN